MPNVLDLAPPEWHAHAACRGTANPDVFYEVQHGRPSLVKPHPAEDAKRICSGCPVRAECLDGALGRREAYGVWGGLTAEERHDLLRAGAA